MAEVVTSVETLKHYIDGEWRESTTEKYMPVTDSSTGEVFAQAPCCTAAESESVRWLTFRQVKDAARPAWAKSVRHRYFYDPDAACVRFGGVLDLPGLHPWLLAQPDVNAPRLG